MLHYIGKTFRLNATETNLPKAFILSMILAFILRMVHFQQQDRTVVLVYGIKIGSKG
jgi:hypothetical protein